jgi:hypothetical protein
MNADEREYPRRWDFRFAFICVHLRLPVQHSSIGLPRQGDCDTHPRGVVSLSCISYY